MTAHDLEAATFPEWSQWGEGAEMEPGRTCETCRHIARLFDIFGERRGWCCAARELYDDVAMVEPSHEACDGWEAARPSTTGRTPTSPSPAA